MKNTMKIAAVMAALLSVQANAVDLETLPYTNVKQKSIVPAIHQTFSTTASISAAVLLGTALKHFYNDGKWKVKDDDTHLIAKTRAMNVISGITLVSLVVKAGFDVVKTVKKFRDYAKAPAAKLEVEAAAEVIAE